MVENRKLVPNYSIQPSQHNLVQEKLWKDPWSLLVANVFLNKTRGTNAIPILYEFLRKFPKPERCTKDKQQSISKLLHPLGLYNRRSRSLVRLAESFIQLRKQYESSVISRSELASRIPKLPGLGLYAQHSWIIFFGETCDDWRTIEEQVTDKKLKLYIDFLNLNQ